MTRHGLLATSVALLAGIGLSAPAEAVSVRAAYDGTTVTVADGAAGDQNGTQDTVEYVEGAGGSGANFPDFDELTLQGTRCGFCPARISFESEVQLGVADAQDDLTLLVSQDNLSLSSAVDWIGRSDFTSIFGDEIEGEFATYWDPSNSLFGTANTIASDTLTGTDSNTVFSPIASQAGNFSITIELVMPEAQLEAASQVQDANAQLRISAVPLPGGLALLVPALAAIGFIGQRRRS